MKRLWLPVSLALALSTTVAHASQPAGVWVKVEKVAFEPNTTAPTRIRIYGAAILYKGPSDGVFLDAYTTPALGYLYYECPSASLATCFDEWQDVQANVNAPPEVCVGLGDQSLPTGRLRPESEAPAGPDGYPIYMGVLQGYTPCQLLADYLRDRPDGGEAGSGGASNTGGTTAGGGGKASGGATSSSGGATGPAGSDTGGRVGAGGATVGPAAGGRVGAGGALAGGGGAPGKADASGGAGQPSMASGGAMEPSATVEKRAKPATTSEDKGCSVGLGPSPGASMSLLAGVALGTAWLRRRRPRRA